MIDPLKLFGTTKDAFNRWLERGHLVTKFPVAQQGRQREFTRENALEVGFMTALTNIGFEPREASGIVAAWMRAERVGNLPWLYTLNPRTGAHQNYGDAHPEMSVRNLCTPVPDEIGSGEWVSEESAPNLLEPDDFQSAVAVCAVFPAEIVSRVDRAIIRAKASK